MFASKITSKGQVTIPRQVREKLKTKAGDFIAFDLKGDTVSIRRVAAFDRQWHAALSGTLEEWSSPEDQEAFRDL
jgi:AbrB family looped-hinge helix DNA binding protein